MSIIRSLQKKGGKSILLYQHYNTGSLPPTVGVGKTTLWGRDKHTIPSYPFVDVTFIEIYNDVTTLHIKIISIVSLLPLETSPEIETYFGMLVHNDSR
jgi:hypothetical protein